jgi:hypothetical protein
LGITVRPASLKAVSKIWPGLKFYKDNPILNRFIEVGTRALRRVLMSGETLRAPRQQLRRLRASAFDFFIFPKPIQFPPKLRALPARVCVFA